MLPVLRSILLLTTSPWQAKATHNNTNDTQLVMAGSEEKRLHLAKKNNSEVNLLLHYTLNGGRGLSVSSTENDSLFKTLFLENRLLEAETGRPLKVRGQPGL